MINFSLNQKMLSIRLKNIDDYYKKNFQILDFIIELLQKRTKYNYIAYRLNKENFKTVYGKNFKPMTVSILIKKYDLYTKAKELGLKEFNFNIINNNTKLYRSVVSNCFFGIDETKLYPEWFKKPLKKTNQKYEIYQKQKIKECLIYRAYNRFGGDIMWIYEMGWWSDNDTRDINSLTENDISCHNIFCKRHGDLH